MKMTARRRLRKKGCIGLSAELRDCGNKDRQNLNNRQFPMTINPAKVPEVPLGFVATSKKSTLYLEVGKIWM